MKTIKKKDTPINCAECEYLLKKALFCKHPKGYFYLSDNYPKIPISCPIFIKNK